jgi:hypothetical protein
MRRRLGGAGEFCLAGIRGLTNEWTVRLNRFIFRRSRLIVDVNAIEGIADDDFLGLNTLASANQGRSARQGDFGPQSRSNGFRPLRNPRSAFLEAA